MTDEHKDIQSADTSDGYDRHEVNVRWVAAITIIVVGAIAVSVLGLYEYFAYEKERQIYELILKPESEMLLEMRALEEKTLSTYGLKDTVTGAYRIPIDSAIQLIADENAHGASSSEAKR